MSFLCPHCEKHFVSKYNLQRHTERNHDSWSTSQKSEEETENEESCEENESGSEESHNTSENTSENSSSGEESSDCEDNDRYSYDDVEAILRFLLQKKE